MGLSEFTPNQVSDFTPIIVFDPMYLFGKLYPTCSLLAGIILSFYEGLMSFQ